MSFIFSISKLVTKGSECLLPISTKKNALRCRRKLVFLMFVFVVCTFVFLYTNTSTNTPKVRPSRLRQQLHSLCVIVPYRDRLEELNEFVPHLTNFLEEQGILHRIFVINQVDSYRFNRGALINVGFKYSTANVSDCDYIAMHDVDLLPLNKNLSYAYPGNEVFHVAAPNLHPLYHYPTFLGGIVLISNHLFQAVDGLSNKYWGWGREDDEFYVRLKSAKITIRKPENIFTNSTNTFKHIHEQKRKRDFKRCFNQKIETSRRDRITGLHNVNYKIQEVHSMTVGEDSVVFVSVELHCNRSMTPWCICEKK